MVPTKRSKASQSWHTLLFATLFLAIKVVVSHGDSDKFEVGIIYKQQKQKTHFVIDDESEAFWHDEAIDLLSKEGDEINERDNKLAFERAPLLRRRRQKEKKKIQDESQPPRSSSTTTVTRLLVERNRKDRLAADFHYPSTTDKYHRILIECRYYGEVGHHHHHSQDDCISNIFSLYGDDDDGNDNNSTKTNNDGYHRRRPIELIHNLESIHAISVEVDTQTLTDIILDGKFVYHNDFVRRPLVLEHSMGYYHPPPSSSITVRNNNNNNRNLLTEYQEIPWGLSAIKAQQIWEEFDVKGEGVKVCILDTGIQASHEDFRESNIDGYYGNEFVSPYWYEDKKGHGTHVGGIITASDNSVGIVGIAPGAETYIVRVFDDSREFYGFADGTTYSTDLIAAATICQEWGADVISASLGGSSYNEIEETFFQNLFYESGIITVAASGNGGNDQNIYPAAYDGVLSVGAVNESLNLADFSTWNRQTTDVLAPGVNILSTFKGNSYRTFSGTSMAAPHASGALVLMLSFVKNKTKKDFTAQDIFNTMKKTLVSTYTTTADRVEESSNSNDDDEYPIGVINVFAAIQYLQDEDEDERRQAVESRIVNFSEPVDISNSTQCANEVRLHICTDSKGYEIYYRLKRLSDDQIIWITKPDTLDNNSKYSEISCLDIANDCYRFDIRDKGGDGIVDGGGVELLYEGDELYRGSNFGRGGMLEFGSGC